MVCNNCKIEFDNINGLKFCPYCGNKIEEQAAPSEKIVIEKEVEVENKSLNKEDDKTRKLHDTLEMPAITEKDIKRYKREKLFKSAIKPFTQLKVIIPVITVFFVIVLGIVGYQFLIDKSVNEGRMKEDLVGKVLTLPKGTKVEIKKGYIRNFVISSRNTSKSEKKDDIKASVTINNGTIEVKTMISIQYTYEGKNQWKLSDKIGLEGETTVKPLLVMEEKQLLEGVKKLNITVGDTEKPLGGEDVKTLQIVERKPDLENMKEEVLLDTGIDSGLIAAAGKVKCKLSFENEAWNITSIEKNSSDDFTLTLSPSLSQDRIIELIKKEGMEESVSNPNVFSGKAFNVKDSFTKSINIADKKYDPQKGILSVTAKRENAAGELKSTLSTDYSFTLNFSKIELSKKSKTSVDNVAIDDMSRDFIAASISNVEIEGGNIFFWFSDNHKITAEEAKTFKLDKITSKKGLLNVKYVYGSITYNDGNKQKATSFVAPYYLVYDSTKGYNWKLDRIVGQDSPNYRNYSQ